ncbi:hypothetical protein AABB24_020417 [Solanum stoloniferum]|uniref:Uncharacterized protein n=1 Tax=Solanum stoloniferum TaxID=62892 RepID=A0ABD2T819_9SOLN
MQQLKRQIKQIIYKLVNMLTNFFKSGWLIIQSSFKIQYILAVTRTLGQLFQLLFKQYQMGYILGNPLTINPDELNYRIPFAHGMGLLSDDLYKALVSNCRGEYQNIAPNNSACSNSVQTFNKLCEGINKEHILEPLCDSVSLKRYRSVGRRTSLYAKLHKLENSMVLPGVKCLEDWRKLSVHWANDDSVQEALHVRKGTIQNWTRCRGDLSFTYNVYNVVPYHANLSAKGYRSLIYSGDHDLTIPFISTEAWIGSLNYSVTDDWRKWIVNGQVAGYTKSYSNNLTFATVKGSGHVAPLWKPLECLTMLTKWISYKQL